MKTADESILKQNGEIEFVRTKHRSLLSSLNMYERFSAINIEQQTHDIEKLETDLKSLNSKIHQDNNNNNANVDERDKLRKQLIDKTIEFKKSVDGINVEAQQLQQSLNELQQTSNNNNNNVTIDELRNVINNINEWCNRRSMALNKHLDSIKQVATTVNDNMQSFIDISREAARLDFSKIDTTTNNKLKTVHNNIVEWKQLCDTPIYNVVAIASAEIDVAQTMLRRFATIVLKR